MRDLIYRTGKPERSRIGIASDSPIVGGVKRNVAAFDPIIHYSQYGVFAFQDFRIKKQKVSARGANQTLQVVIEIPCPCAGGTTCRCRLG